MTLRTLLRASAFSLLGTSLIGCAAEVDSGSDCLPGDIECSTDGGGDGKADGFDYKNDPTRMSQNLQYRLAELPKRGKLTTPVWKAQYPQAATDGVPVAWADTYWPTSDGSHNTRWQGEDERSPIEKYDAAFNGANGCAEQPDSVCGTGSKAAWDTYNQCAGPAAKWQSNTFQGGGKQHDGIDNNNDGKIDECSGSDGNDGVATWWGTCHAWSPAALMTPEPQHDVTINGVTFNPGDIKALIQNSFDATSAVMLGGRCNAKEIEHDPTTSANDECSDVNPGSLHVILTNFLGIAQLPLVEDRTANYEVWNQPVLGYEVTKQAKISKTAANRCVGGTGGSTWTYNPAAVTLYEVRTRVDYLTESYASNDPVGFEDNTSSDTYHYILELNADGKVIGGRYCTDSDNTHIDFLWSPTGNNRPNNPYVDGAKVKELIAKSVAAEGGGGGGGGGGTTFTGATNVNIPDNSPAGVTISIPVTGVSGSKPLAVSVDIQHTYRGDLTVSLLRNGTLVRTLSDKAGGSADDLVQTYTLTAAEAGAANATWGLKVVDSASQDTGKVRSVKLTFGI
jgi:hypothetical protein